MSRTKLEATRKGGLGFVGFKIALTQWTLFAALFYDHGQK